MAADTLTLALNGDVPLKTFDHTSIKADKFHMRAPVIFTHHFYYSGVIIGSIPGGIELILVLN